MTLFGHTCPHCGQDMPEQAATSFDAFWADCPHKVNKDQARRNWSKMTAGNQEIAHKAVKRFYAWFAATYPTASPLHPATYLSKRRWLDLEPEKAADQSKVVAYHRANLRSRSPAVAEASRRALIKMGLEGEST